MKLMPARLLDGLKSFLDTIDNKNEVRRLQVSTNLLRRFSGVYEAADSAILHFFIDLTQYDASVAEVAIKWLA